MKKLKSILISVAMLVGLVGFSAQPVAAINLFKSCSGSSVCTEANDRGAAPKLIQNLINLLLYVIGIIAVIVIIVSGIKYVTSDGDSNKISSAKNTLLYAIIGLVVAMLAFAIVNFVVASFS